MCSFETPSYLSNISPCLLSPDPRLQLNPLPAHRTLSLFHHRAVETSFVHLSTPQPKNRIYYSGASFRNRQRRCDVLHIQPYRAHHATPQTYEDALSDTRDTEKLATHSLHWIMLDTIFTAETPRISTHSRRNRGQKTVLTDKKHSRVQNTTETKHHE